MAVRSSDNHLEKEKGKLGVCGEFTRFVDDRTDRKQLGLVLVENKSLIFRNTVFKLVICSDPTLNRRLVICVIKVDAGLVVLQNLKLGKVCVNHSEGHLKGVFHSFKLRCIFK